MGMAAATASISIWLWYQGGIMSALSQERGVRAAFDHGPSF
jgi:hypothetical protein